MNINEFVAQRKGDWRRLEEIAERFMAGRTAHMTKQELWELGRLYQGAVSDLALLRSSEYGLDFHNPVIKYLNALIVRIHGIIYQRPAFRIGAVSDFLVYEIPAAVRNSWKYVAVSATIFVFAALVGWVLGLDKPGFIELLVPDRIISKVERGQVWFDDLWTMAPQASSSLMTHNISVTFLSIAAGMTFGVGTVYLLALNGLLLGTIGALCYKNGLSVKLWSFVVPHGSVEISAIIIGGAAGLILGHALWDPGPYRRTEWLGFRGREAGKLSLAVVPLLIIAGIVEAFFSPSPLPPTVKFAAAALLFGALVLFFAVSGRGAVSSGSEVVEEIPH